MLGNNRKRCLLVKNFLDIQNIDRNREDYRGILFARNLSERLQVPKLNSIGGSGHHGGGISQFLRRLQFAFSVNDLGAPLALGLGLLGHGALHLEWQVDIFDFDHAHLDTPWFSLCIDYFLKFSIDLITVGQQIIELKLTQNGP